MVSLQVLRVKSLAAFGVASALTEIGEAIWHDYMPNALMRGTFLAKPDPFIIKSGPAKVEKGIKMLRNALSAKKP